MKRIFLFAALSLLVSNYAGANVKSFTEESPDDKSDILNKEKPVEKFDDLFEGKSQLYRYRQFSNRIQVPGFVSASPIDDIAKLIGPNSISNSFRVGDTVFFRWGDGPEAKVGQTFSTYTPAVVLQNETDPTEFSVRLRAADEKPPKGLRTAGYFYEATGQVRITQIRQGLVEGVITKLSGPISLDDHLMPVIAMKNIAAPIIGGVDLKATIVAGSPVDRISTSNRSFFYINRGEKDGMKEGRVFQSLENVPLQGVEKGKDMIAGEAMIVYVTEHYSTAMITRQFDVIRVGAMLTTKQPNSGATPKKPFYKMNPDEKMEEAGVSSDYEEIPTLESLEASQDPSLPDPTQAPPPVPAAPKAAPREPTMSELDAIEKSQKFQALDAAERKRLGSLSRQEKIGGEAKDDDLAAPGVAPVDSSFGDAPAASKKPAKKRRAGKTRDEEELNQLMMQN